jgi:hypothetical protein
MSSPTELDPIDPLPDTLGPDAELWGRALPDPRGLRLFRRGDATPFVTLGIDATFSSVVFPFSRDGRFLAWGNADGSVTVCNLEEVQRRLKEVGLGW